MRERIKKWLLWELAIWFGEFKWCRKFIGGKWEYWCTGCIGPHWFHVEEFARISGKRPGNTFGTCNEEDYTTYVGWNPTVHYALGTPVTFKGEKCKILEEGTNNPPDGSDPFCFRCSAYHPKGYPCLMPREY
jgi:hypothetical protein